MPLFSTLCPFPTSLGIALSSAGLASLLTYLYYNPHPKSLKSAILKIVDWEATLTPSSNRSTFTLNRNISAFGTGPESQVTHHILLSPEECESKLTRNQNTYKINRLGNPVTKIEISSLSANEKCEDEISIDLLTRSDMNNLRDGDVEGNKGFWEFWGELRSKLSLPSINHASSFSDSEGNSEAKIHAQDGLQDLMFLSVMDGHGGGQTSSLLKKVLHGTISWGLGGLQEWTSKCIYDKIIESYLALDHDICHGGLSVAQAPSTSKETALPTPNPSLLALIPNAGSTSCTAFIDIKAELLYLINLGDSRAVAGWYNEKEGKWRVDILSQDHECGNPNEVERLNGKHSKHDNVVIHEGYTSRLLGNMQPSRVFGDEGLKVTQAEKNSIETAGQVRFCADESPFTGKKKIPYVDPPYLDAEPEIVIRKLRESNDEKLKFLIVATDGLWDKISSEQAVLLLSSHLTHPNHPPIPKSDLPSLFPQTTPNEKRPYPAEDLPGTSAENSKGHWLFRDDNSATHLIRNGLDGDGDKSIQEMILSLSGRGTREIRDDTSVIVVHFDTDRLDCKEEGKTG